MSDETITSSASTFDEFASGSSYDPDAISVDSVESAQESLLEKMITQVIDYQARFLDKDTEIAKLKLENFNLKLKNDTDDIEIALLELEYKFDMLELKLFAAFGYEL
jgi:hypothetical protein